MSGVVNQTVAANEDDMRLDRWFKQHYPTLARGRLEKLLRTGQIRVDGGRVKAALRLSEGQVVRVPPLGELPPSAKPGWKAVKAAKAFDPAIVAQLQAAVLYRDDAVLVLNKPAGLPVQGGSGAPVHVDGALDGLCFDANERPRLVHRLDKDTSGVLVLARSAAAARWLTAAFRAHDTQKLYWAITVGEPKPAQGQIDLPLAKREGRGGEKMMVDRTHGKRALSRFSVIESLAGKASFVAMTPITGRTHQLRVHMAEIATPVLGDGKYGGPAAFLVGDGVSRKLHLHARRIRLTRPDGGIVDVRAPTVGHMAQSMAFFDFDGRLGDAAFEQLFDAGG